MIFEPFRLAPGLIARNRVFRAATCESAADFDGTPNGHMADILSGLKGTGLVISGFCFTSTDGRAVQPRQSGLCSDEHLNGWKRTLDKVKEHLGKTPLVAQLAHAGAQSLSQDGTPLISPSGVSSPFFRGPSRPITINEIERVVGDFAHCASLACDAGFDGVQLHAGHGYLLHQFLSPATNSRKDEHGSDRFRIIAEITEAIRKAVPQMPILMKLSAEDDDDNGMTPLLAAQYCERAREAGVACCELSYGTMDYAMNIFRGGLPVREALQHTKALKGLSPLARTVFRTVGVGLIKRKLKPFKPLYNLDIALQVRERTSLPLALTGGVRSVADCEKAIEAGFDAVTMCRPLVHEPGLVARWENGDQRPSDCSNCNLCAVYTESDEHLKCRQKEQ